MRTDIRRFGRVAPAIALLILPLGGGGVDGAQQGRGQSSPIRILPPQPPEPLVRGGPEPDLEMLFTSEVHGFYQPCG